MSLMDEAMTMLATERVRPVEERAEHQRKQFEWSADTQRMLRKKMLAFYLEQLQRKGR